MKRSIFILILITLFSFGSNGQTGYDYFDTTTWTKIDSIGVRSSSSLIAFYKDSIQKIRVDQIGNSSSTYVFYLVNNQLSTVVIVTDVPARKPRQIEDRYTFSYGKITSWADGLGHEDTNPSSTSFETEETRILELFNHYFEMVSEYSAKKE